MMAASIDHVLVLHSLMSAPAERGEETRLRRHVVLLVCAIFLAEGLLRTSYFHLGARVSGSGRPFLDSLASELTGSAATLLVFFAIVIPASRRWPLRGAHWPHHLLAHAAALLAFSIVKTGLMWSMRVPLWRLIGLGRYDYGDPGYVIPMEFSNDVFSYAILVGVVHAWHAWQRMRDRELREARLEASLGEARLQALQGQLQPHFLFNTLNVISSVMYNEPERADRLMSRLSDLLRSSLSAPQRPEVPLEEELHLLREYIEIMRARFGERLVVRLRTGTEAHGAKVPLFLLQPLVENAIQHGLARHSGAAAIEISVEREGLQLVVRVTDDGPGIAGDAESAFGRGVGLSNTRARIRHLYGEAGSIALANRAQGGLEVTVRLPFERAAETAFPARDDAATASVSTTPMERVEGD